MINEVDVVSNLNDRLFEIRLFGKEDNFSRFRFDLITDGFVSIIEFIGIQIYNSELDSSDEIEEAGGLEEFCVKEVNKLIKELKKLKL